MRQLATFDTADHARRLTAYLVTQRIAAHAEEDGGNYNIWVRDEDQMAAAREALDQFRANPDDPKYSGVEMAAHALKRKQEAEREARQKNVVEMRGRWGSGPGGVRRKCPVTIGLIVASILVALATNFGSYGDEGPGWLLSQLLFVDPLAMIMSVMRGAPDFFSSIQSGQIWRLVTPIFIHYGIMHIVFNMWLMFVEGGQIEDRRGSVYMVLFVLVSAILSNVGQALTAQWLEQPSLFGGMSGVAYAAFGYLWMKVKFAPAEGYQMDKQTVVMALLWLVLCILRDVPGLDDLLDGFIPRIANTAHVVGLVVGMAAGYAPLLLKRP